MGNRNLHPILRLPCLWLFLILFFFTYTSFAQTPLGEIQAFGGKVQVQKEGAKVWTRANKKDPLAAGDLIKTGYKSFSILKIGNENKLVLGSSTRALIENIPGQVGKVKVTLYEGGIYFTWPEGAGIEVFTTDAVLKTSAGTFAILYNKAEKQTLFFNLTGTETVESITKKEPVKLSPGQFSLVQPSENPSAPEQVNTAIADQLRKFFGDQFITKEMEKHGIQISTTGTQEVKAGTTEKEDIKLDDNTRVIPFFQITDILKKIRTIEGIEKPMYQAPYWYDDQLDYQFFAEVKGRMLNITEPTISFPNPYGIFLRGGFRKNSISMGFNLPIESDAEGSTSINTFSGIQGILDKIYFFDYQPARGLWNLHLGNISDLTFGKGLLVNKFGNELYSQIPQPLGLLLQVDPHHFFNLTYFIGDLSRPNFMGGNLNFDNGWTTLGASLVADFNQGAAYTYGDEKFRGNKFPKPNQKSKTKSIYGSEFYGQFNFIEDDGLTAYAYSGLSFIYNENFEVEGATAQIPALNIVWKRLSAYIEGIITFDKSHWGYFNNYYLEDRVRIYRQEIKENGPLKINISDSIYAFSLNEIHPPMAISKGFKAGIEWQILDRLWLGLGYGQNFSQVVPKMRVDSNKSNTSYTVYFPNESGIDTYVYNYTQTVYDTLDYISPEERGLLGLMNQNHNIQFRIFAGNDLIANLKRFEAYYNLQGGFFNRQIFLQNNNSVPLVSKHSESFYLSGNTNFGILLEYQILSKSSILAELRGYTHDFNGNAIFDTDDLITEFSMSWRSNF